MLILSIVFASALASSAILVNFDSAPVGTTPVGWTSVLSGKGNPGKWEILHDPSAPSAPGVLAQTAVDKTSPRFPLCILDADGFVDGEISVRFKPVSGTVDQGAGLVWRYRDQNNYYIVRANALEDNVVLYKMENGKRISIAPKGTPEKTYGVKHPVDAGQWASLAVRFQGNHFAVLLDGKLLFEVEDATFPGAGKVGLWTKADSVTWFDDFRVSPAAR